MLQAVTRRSQGLNRLISEAKNAANQAQHGAARLSTKICNSSSRPQPTHESLCMKAPNGGHKGRGRRLEPSVGAAAAAAPLASRFMEFIRGHNLLPLSTDPGITWGATAGSRAGRRRPTLVGGGGATQWEMGITQGYMSIHAGRKITVQEVRIRSKGSRVCEADGRSNG